MKSITLLGKHYILEYIVICHKGIQLVIMSCLYLHAIVGFLKGPSTDCCSFLKFTVMDNDLSKTTSSEFYPVLHRMS